MPNTEVDPFDASASILRNAPEDSALRARVEANLRLPVTRSDFIDVMIAQSHINVMIAGALVHLRRSDYEALSKSLEELLDRVQQSSQSVADIMGKMVIDDRLRKVLDADSQSNG